MTSRLPDTYADWDATALTAALRSKVLSVGEALDEHLSRLDRFSDLNAIVARQDPKILSEEAELAQARYNRSSASVLEGVPMTVKDTIAVAGLPLSAGSKLLKSHRASWDAAVVSQMRQGGALVIGKSNCPEFGFGIGCSNDLFGTTSNPLDKCLSPGGSSGGEAASVAAGISLVGIGTDYGGSLRWPAQCTGILALRPTPGRLRGNGQLIGEGAHGLDGNATFPNNSLQGEIQVPGFLARSVSDLEKALFEAQRLVRKSATTSYQPGTSSEIELEAVSIGWSDGANIGLVGDDVAMMMGGLADSLVNDRLKLFHVPDAFSGAREAFDELRSFEELADLRNLAHSQESELTPAMRNIVQNPPRSREYFAQAQALARRRRADGLVQLRSTPLFLLPVAGSGAIGHDETATIKGAKVGGFELMAHCRAISLLAVPVVSIPAGKSKDGMPLSVQVIAPPFAEYLALALAQRIESLMGGWQKAPGTRRVLSRNDLDQ